MNLDGRSPRLLRRINAASTARLLHESGPLTLAQLVERTGLSRRTAEAALETLRGEALVERQGPSPGKGAGRPARTYRFRHESGACLGVAVRRTSVETVVTDLAGATLATARRRVGASASRRERLSALRQCARTALRRAGRTDADLRGAAVGTPGIVRSDGVVTRCTTIPDWEGFDLAAELERWTGCPVTVDNDVNMAARAERRHGSATDEKDLIWVLTGRHTRAAIVIDGELYRGPDGAAGEIGWLPALRWAEVRDLAGGRADAAGAGGPDRAPLTGRDSDLASALASGLAALVLTVNPRCLVLGGVCAGAEPSFLAAVHAELAPLCLAVPTVRASALGEEAVVLGAAHSAVTAVQHRLFSVEQEQPPRGRSPRPGPQQTDAPGR